MTKRDPRLDDPNRNPWFKDKGKDKDRTYEDQAAELVTAYGTYLTKLAALSGIHRCSSVWSDGLTRCQLVAGHELGEDCTPHRHKPAGATHAVVLW